MRSPADLGGASSDVLHRGAFARLAYRLGRSRATGVLSISGVRAEQPELVILRHGEVMAQGIDPLGRLTRQRLARIAATDGATYRFLGGSTSYPGGTIQKQFSFAGWARQHIEAQLDAGRARELVEELAGVRLLIKPHLAPDRSLCDKTDLRILEAMRRPLRLDQIWPLARTPRFRLLTFLHFLRAVGAVTMVGVAAPAPTPRPALAHQLLGVSTGADRETVKRAYRRLARALHPDLHPELTSERRRALELKLAAVTTAYRELSDQA